MQLVSFISQCHSSHWGMLQNCRIELQFRGGGRTSVLKYFVISFPSRTKTTKETPFFKWFFPLSGILGGGRKRKTMVIYQCLNVQVSVFANWTQTFLLTNNKRKNVAWLQREAEQLPRNRPQWDQSLYISCPRGQESSHFLRFPPDYLRALFYAGSKDALYKMIQLLG